MKTLALFTLFTMAAASVPAADAKSEVEAAAKKLGEKASYSWTAKTESASRLGEGDREGKIEKGGYAVLNMAVRDGQQLQAVFKGEKGVVKVGENWQTIEALAESEDEETRRLRFVVRRLQGFKPPHLEVQELLKNAKAVEKDEEDGIYTGQLTPEGVKAVYGRGFRRGSDAPDVSSLSGRVKFWIKDGALTKYSRHVEGSLKFGERDMDIDTTTTTEIKDVGATKLTAPEEAKKKLSS